jgi:hypothetical protein
LENKLIEPGKSPRDLLRQNSRNFLFLHRVTVSGLTRMNSEDRSFQILDSNDHGFSAWVASPFAGTR